MRKGILGCLLVVVAMGATASSAQQGDPDVVPAPPNPAGGLPDLAIHRITDVKAWPFVTPRGRKIRRRWSVRFSTIIDNRGPGHLIIRAHRDRTGQPCTPASDPKNRCERGDMTA